MTAAVLAPVAISAVLFLPTVLFAAVLAIIVGMGAWEWSKLAGISSRRMRRRYVGLVICSLLLIGLLLNDRFLSFLLVLVLAWWLVAATWVARYPASASAWMAAPWRGGGIGLLILLPPWAALVALHGHGEQGPALVLLLFLLIWGADSGAYFAGRKWGKDKLAPQVSPGKSWQGLWGGMIAALLVALLFISLSLVNIKYPVYFVTICIVTILFSILGDLVESMFKRSAGVKDSGSVLPGHGGVLDRIDSLTAAAPVFVLGTLGVCL